MDIILSTEDNDDIKYPLYRDDIYSKAKRLSDYEKMKVLHRSVSWMVEHIEDDIEGHGTPRNKRQSILQGYDRYNLRVLTRQKTRLEERMSQLEKVIKKDIEGEL